MRTTKPTSEKSDEKISNMISYTAQIYSVEFDSSETWTSIFETPVHSPNYWAIEPIKSVSNSGRFWDFR